MAQKALYDKYAPQMLSTIRRYVSRIDDAEDILVEGMYKVLDRIDSYKSNGSFEGWVRRIIINESLMFLRKNHALKKAASLDNVNTLHFSRSPATNGNLEAQDILSLLERLPVGYRTVFNLYVIEGYKHREIAEMLGISINTSKSQLILAKQKMRQILSAINYPIADYASVKSNSKK